MATNTIQIKAINTTPPSVDNELYLIAIATGGGSSYQLAHVQSGYYHAATIAVSISAGTYAEPALINGLGGDLNISSAVSIPSGTYTILGVGINWGGPWSFSYTVNSNTSQAGSNQNQSNGAVGVVWQSSTADQITV